MIWIIVLILLIIIIALSVLFKTVYQKDEEKELLDKLRKIQNEKTLYKWADSVRSTSDTRDKLKRYEMEEAYYKYLLKIN